MSTVAFTCFMCFRYMLHIFYQDITKIDLVLHMLKWLYMNVASICFKCFRCFKRMWQVFYLDVAYVAMVIHVYCKCMFQIFQLFKTYVACVLFGCCICSTAHTHMLQNICCKYFIYFRRAIQQMLLYWKCFMSKRGKGGTGEKWSSWAQWSSRAHGKWSGRGSRRGA
jgi:hypothetical protein